MGGRQKGTKNKVSSDLREWLSSVIDENRSQIQDDLKNILPEDRLKILSGLMNYVIPKKQALTIEEEVEKETQVLTRWLSEAPDEAIEAISQRVIALQQANEERNRQE